MKKLLLVMAAAFAMVACQTDINEVGVVGGEVDVTFEVGTPTRAYSDGTTATHLQYAIYEGTTELDALTVTNGEIHGSTTVSFKLVTGNTYTVIFWAAAPNAPYSVDWATGTMTVNYEAAKTLCNDENRDAFYAKHEFTVKGAQTEIIELRRPFAQLNIGTSDYLASTHAGYTPNQSYVKVTNIYNTLDFWSGAVSGETAVEFAYADIKKDETFPVGGYEYLAMNYLLVNGKETVDVEFAYKETSTGDAKTRIVGSVPVQRNYRTNIYGQLLTSDVDINVVIKPEYEEPAHELAALQNAALNGGTVTLTEDVVLTTPLEVVGKMTINLNGKTISGELHKSVGPIIKNSGTLTIIGGTISSLANNGGSAIANYGTLTVEDATLNGAPREGDSWPSYPVNNYGDMTLTNTTIVGYQGCVALNAAGTTVINNCELTKNYLKTSSHVFYVNHADAKVIVNGGTYNHNGFDGSLAYVIAGEVTINGGTFNAKDGGYGFAALSAGKVIINGGNINAGLLNWGGQFVVNGGVFTSQPSASYLAEGLKTIKKDGKFYVVADTVDAVVADATELQAALAAGGEVVLAGDVTYTSNKIENDAVINLNGNTFKPSNAINLNNNADLTMVGGDYEVNVYSGYVDVRPSSADGSTVVYENVHFTSNYINKTNGNSTDRLNSVVEVCAVATDAKTVIKFKNCTFDNGKVLIEGMSGKIGIVEAVFEGCTFNALTNSSPIDVMNYVTGTIEVKDCTFNLECTSGVASAIDVSPSSSTSVVLTATNNTFNAVAATPYTYDASKGETEAHNVKVNGTPANIKFISAYANTTVTETGTKKSGIAKL